MGRTRIAMTAVAGVKVALVLAALSRLVVMPLMTRLLYAPSHTENVLPFERRGESLHARQWKVVAERATSDLVDAVAGAVLAAVNEEATDGKGVKGLQQAVHVLQEKYPAIVAQVEEQKRELAAVKEELEVVKQWRRAVIDGKLKLDVKEEVRESKGDQQQIWKVSVEF
ncbi:unnamed protein product [Closterium sp. Naga37s-1]|nr:unnamed protein product [Closterium sp. Naga37s-1]